MVDGCIGDRIVFERGFDFLHSQVYSFGTHGVFHSHDDIRWEFL